MNERVIRSLFGAFLCAFMTILPAGIWDLPILLAPGALFGWIIGYHGDRIGYGLKIGWKEGSVWWSSVHIPLSWLKTEVPLGIAFGALGSVARVFSDIIQSIFWWMVNIIIIAYERIVATPNQFHTWVGIRTINKAVAIRAVIMILFVMVSMLGLWKLIIFYGPQVGDIEPLGIGVEGVREGGRILMMIMILTLLPIPFLNVAILVFETRTWNGCYSLWKRYNRRGLVHFVLGELLRIIWTQMWIIGIEILFMAWLLLGGISLLVFGVIFLMIVTAGVRFSWNLVCINKDSGLISLLVGFVVGTITFFNYRPELVADNISLLLICVVAGVVAGVVFSLLTYGGDILFQRKGLLFRVATEGVIDKDGKDRFVIFVMYPLVKIYERGFSFIWKDLGASLLPRSLAPLAI